MSWAEGRGRLCESWAVWGMGRAGKLPLGAGMAGSLLNLGGLFGVPPNPVTSLKPVVKKVMN